MQVMRNLLPQRKRAARVGRLQQPRRVFAQHAPRKLRPGRKRKAAVVHDICFEIVVELLGSLAFVHRLVRNFGVRGGRRRDLLLHEVAAARRGNDVSLGGQLTVGGFDRNLADAEVRSELPLARQARAAREGPVHDVAAHRAVELFIERRAAARLKMIGQHCFSLFSLCFRVKKSLFSGIDSFIISEKRDNVKSARAT